MKIELSQKGYYNSEQQNSVSSSIQDAQIRQRLEIQNIKNG
jgi:hypothetical protein